MHIVGRRCSFTEEGAGRRFEGVLVGQIYRGRVRADRVFLIRVMKEGENTISMDGVHYYPITMPKDSNGEEVSKTVSMGTAWVSRAQELVKSKLGVTFSHEESKAIPGVVANSNFARTLESVFSRTPFKVGGVFGIRNRSKSLSSDVIEAGGIDSAGLSSEAIEAGGTDSAESSAESTDQLGWKESGPVNSKAIDSVFQMSDSFAGLSGGVHENYLPSFASGDKSTVSLINDSKPSFTSGDKSAVSLINDSNEVVGNGSLITPRAIGVETATGAQSRKEIKEVELEGVSTLQNRYDEALVETLEMVSTQEERIKNLERNSNYVAQLEQKLRQISEKGEMEMAGVKERVGILQRGLERNDANFRGVMRWTEDLKLRVGGLEKRGPFAQSSCGNPSSVMDAGLEVGLTYSPRDCEPACGRDSQTPPRPPGLSKTSNISSSDKVSNGSNGGESKPRSVFDWKTREKWDSSKLLRLYLSDIFVDYSDSFAGSEDVLAAKIMEASGKLLENAPGASDRLKSLMSDGNITKGGLLEAGKLYSALYEGDTEDKELEAQNLEESPAQYFDKFQVYARETGIRGGGEDKTFKEEK